MPRGTPLRTRRVEGVQQACDPPDEYFYISWDGAVALLRQLRAASVCAFFLLSHLLLVYREGANGAVLLVHGRGVCVRFC